MRGAGAAIGLRQWKQCFPVREDGWKLAERMLPYVSGAQKNDQRIDRLSAERKRVKQTPKRAVKMKGRHQTWFH